MLRKLEKYIKIKNQDPCISVREECHELEMCLKENKDPEEYVFKPGQHVYMTGFSGEKGTELISRFHRHLIKELPDVTVYETGFEWLDVQFKNPYVLKAGEKGVFHCLFELHELSGLGFEIKADMIPVSPYTCAVTDLLGLDPFKLLSTGCRLQIISEDENAEAIQRIQYAGISGVRGYPVLIGHLTNDSEMKIIHSDSYSLLNRIKRDELLKILDTVS